MKKVLKTILKYLSIAFLVLCFVKIAVQRFKGEIPTLFNYSIFVIATDSMTPNYNVDDVILVKHVEPSKINKYSVVTFIGEVDPYTGLTITHRVVEEPKVVDGIYYFQTQGDKEGATLDPVISEDQIVGVVVGKLRIIGFLYNLIMEPVGFVCIIMIPFSIIIVLQIFTMRKTEDEEDVDEKDLQSNNK